MSNRVYMLSGYEEHGSTDCRITLDKAKVPTIFGQMFSNTSRNSPERFEAMKAELLRLLELDELTPRSGDDLTSEWGICQLHILELE